MTTIIDANGNELLEEAEMDVTDGNGPLLNTQSVSNGEEDYECIWSEKSKLKRFDEGENCWKDRGQGVAKILKKKDNSNTFMFIFRWDTIGKLGAQHFLVKGTHAKLFPSNNKYCSWRAAKDYVDDEVGYPESFLLKFSSTELAEKAMSEINKAASLSST